MIDLSLFARFLHLKDFGGPALQSDDITKSGSNSGFFIIFFDRHGLTPGFHFDIWI